MAKKKTNNTDSNKGKKVNLTEHRKNTQTKGSRTGTRPKSKDN
ncbi:hypothetical protein SAMN04487762_1961 [Polaribacter sp. Hel1_33_78]|jgi:hypothetical protein|nr:hypothetical protein SAMN04487762_1961 [Polaribacter sp. Hel1_33_78]